MSNSSSYGIQLSDRCGLGDCLNTVETSKKEFPSIARKLRELQTQRLRSTWAGFNMQQKKKRLCEEEQKLTVFSLPPLFLTQQKQVEEAIESPKPKLVKTPSPVKTTKSPTSPPEVPTTQMEEQPPLVIPASPIAEPMEDSQPTAPAFQSLPTHQTVFNAFQTGPTVVFSQTSHQQPSHQQVPHPVGDQQLRRKVKVNRTRRYEEMEGPPGEVQRRQTFADFGQPEMQNQFQYTEHRPSAPVIPVQDVQIHPPQQPTWNLQPMQQFQQPAPSFAPPPQEVAPVPGFSIGRAATPKRGHTKQRNRRVRR